MSWKRSFLFAGAAAMLASGCRPPNLYYARPSGPPEYQLGWEDGCDTGIAAQGGVMYQLLYGFKKRPEMGNNDLYKQAWNEGFSYCRFVVGSEPQTNWLGNDIK